MGHPVTGGRLMMRLVWSLGHNQSIRIGFLFNAIAKIPSLCAVSVKAAVLGLVVDEETGGAVERTAPGWILASQKKTVFPRVW